MTLRQGRSNKKIEAIIDHADMMRFTERKMLVKVAEGDDPRGRKGSEFRSSSVRVGNCTPQDCRRGASAYFYKGSAIRCVA